MDILLPPLQRQVAPSAKRLLRENLDLRSLVASQAGRMPLASGDEIVARLSESGVSVPGVWVARWLTQRPDYAQRKRTGTGRVAPLPTPRSAAARIAPAHQTIPAMSSGDRALRAINRLFAGMYYSLARYVQGASPWMRPGDAALWKLIQRIAGEHEELATRAARLVIDRRERLEHGQYPAEFTANNDLALEHLAGKLADDQRRLIDALEQPHIDVSHDEEAADLLASAIASQRQSLLDLEHALENRAQALAAPLDISGLPTADAAHDAPTRADVRQTIGARTTAGESQTAA